MLVSENDGYSIANRNGEWNVTVPVGVDIDDFSVIE